MPNELVHLRIGAWILHADAMVLPVAGFFFAVLASRALRPGIVRPAGHARLAMFVLCVGGIIGARVYGLFQPFYAGEPIVAGGAWRALRFGSLGGIYGVFLAAAIIGMCIRRANVLTVWDAIVPAVAASAAIARIACVFQGCCVGVHADANHINTWPFLDIAALLIALQAARFVSGKCRESGTQAVTFLCTYGLLRFSAEAFRDTFTAMGGLTWGQLLTAVQVLLALGLAVYVRTHTAQTTQLVTR